MNKVLSFKEYLVLKEQYRNLSIKKFHKFLIESVIEENIKNYIRNNSSNEDLIIEIFRWFKNSKSEIFKNQSNKKDNSGYIFTIKNEDFYIYIYITNNQKIYRYEQNSKIKINDELIINPTKIKNIEEISFKEYPHLQYLTLLINSQLK